MSECMKKLPGVAVELIDKLLAELESGISEQQDDEEEQPDVVLQTHIMGVLSNLIFALDGSSDKIPNFIDRLQNLILVCNNFAQQLRERLYSDLENSLFFFNEYVDVPVISEEQYDALEAFKKFSQEATMEVVNSGKTDKLNSLQEKRHELDVNIDSMSENLRRMATLALHGTSGYGLYHALSKNCSEGRLINCFQFLTELLNNEHRGIRMISVEALSTLTSIQLEDETLKDNFIKKIHSVVQQISKRVKEENSSLYRKKADMIMLLAQLSIHVEDRLVRLGIIRMLISMWRDPDSEVRSTSIKMVQLMSENNIQEVAECFAANDDSETNLEKDDAKILVPNIMRHIATLINNVEFGEKEELFDLMKYTLNDHFSVSK
ncbi:hypothetical protein HK096_003736 [Nowakowskiella sp. JEL0078]|nr:hypothetical protein HK096_003736 [Nowakowskiella sp. JEL0078]